MMMTAQTPSHYSYYSPLLLTACVTAMVSVCACIQPTAMLVQMVLLCSFNLAVSFQCFLGALHKANVQNAETCATALKVVAIMASYLRQEEEKEEANTKQQQVAEAAAATEEEEAAPASPTPGSDHGSTTLSAKTTDCSCGGDAP